MFGQEGNYLLLRSVHKYARNSLPWIHAPARFIAPSFSFADHRASCGAQDTFLENEPKRTEIEPQGAQNRLWSSNGGARRAQRSEACADCVNLSACAHASAPFTHPAAANFVKTNPTDVCATDVQVGRSPMQHTPSHCKALYFTMRRGWIRARTPRPCDCKIEPNPNCSEA